MLHLSGTCNLSAIFCYIYINYFLKTIFAFNKIYQNLLLTSNVPMNRKETAHVILLVGYIRHRCQGFGSRAGSVSRTQLWPDVRSKPAPSLPELSWVMLGVLWESRWKEGKTAEQDQPGGEREREKMQERHPCNHQGQCRRSGGGAVQQISFLLLQFYVFLHKLYLPSFFLTLLRQKKNIGKQF